MGSLLNPGIGLVIWMTFSFFLLLLLLKKFAWKPILSMIKTREESIASALNAAKEAEAKLIALQADNEKLLAEARKERDEMLKVARETKDKIVAAAETEAKAKADKIAKEANEAIQLEKQKALTELRNEVATLSVQVAETILKKELTSEDKQKELVSKLVSDITFN